MGKLHGTVIIACLLLSLSCKKQEEEAVTTAEAKQAIEEASLSEQAATVINGTITISTDFTIGQAVQDAAEEIRAFIESQLPCAEVTLVDATLTIEYGAKAGDCTYKGQTYSGSHSIHVVRNEEGDVVVDHEWDQLSNQRVSVTGAATVTWDFAEGSRQVVHELDWTRLSDGRTATGSGDRTQQVLEGGIFEGIQIDGARAWDGEAGHWDLDIDGVQVRWIDPAPQAGTYTLTTPFDGKTLTMTFERVDNSTIKVTIASGDKEFAFNINALGIPSEA